MTEAEQRFATAYMAWRLNYAPKPRDFGIDTTRARQIIKQIDTVLEKERLGPPRQPPKADD